MSDSMQCEWIHSNGFVYTRRDCTRVIYESSIFSFYATGENT